MKKTKMLFMLPLLLLAACDTTSSSSSEPLVKSFEDKLVAVQGNVKLTGTLSYQFYNSETGEPSASKPMVNNLNVEFTDAGYVLSYDGEFDESFTETLFKSTDNTVELRYINNLNELTVERPTNDDGEEYSFDSYTNPFRLLNSENLLVSDNETKATFDLETNLELANDFVGRLTYYNFGELEEVTLTADENGLTNIHIVTPVLAELMRQGVYTFDLTVAATGDTVKGPVTPEPKEPNEKQAVLESALEELLTKDYEAALHFDAWGEAYNYNFYKKTNEAFLVIDPSYPNYSMGVMRFEEQMYELSYNRATKSYEKVLNDRLSESDLTPDWTMISPVIFTTSEDGKEFTLSAETIDKTYVRAFALATTGGLVYDLASSDRVTIKLNEENHVSSIEYVSNDGFFENASLTFAKVGACTLPFNVADLAVAE